MRRLAVGLLALAFLATPLFADDKKDDERQRDEEFVQKLLEIIQKTAEQAADTSLDKTPYGALEGDDLAAAEEIGRRLDNQRLSLNFDDSAFPEAIDFFRDATGINVVITNKAKELTENAPKLKLKLKDVKVRNALELVLSQTDAQLRYGVRNGVLQIGVVDEWKDRDMILEIIPIDDLVSLPPDFPAPPAGLDAIEKQFSKWKK